MDHVEHGVIWVGATPIGNVGDASQRLREALAAADWIGAEDTRRLQALCKRLDISPGGRVVALHDHNEAQRGGELVEAALAGQNVLLVSDAGTPTVSDPGFKIGQLAIEKGVRLSPIPGPSAALAALSVAGLPTDRFAFEGFLPRKRGEIVRRLEQVAGDQRTHIWFESPRRLGATLQLMGSVFGEDRQAAVCRELTKTHEEVRRGTLKELAEHFSAGSLGEITVVVAGAPQSSQATVEDAAEQAGELADRGLRLKEAAEIVAERTGLRKKQIYDAALHRK